MYIHIGTEASFNIHFAPYRLIAISCLYQSSVGIVSQTPLSATGVGSLLIC